MSTNSTGFDIAAILAKLSETKQNDNISDIVGYRKSGSDIGTWNDAFVAARKSNGAITLAFFEKGQDFIGHPSWAEVQKIVEEYKQKGWQPMSRDDIKQVAGI